MSAFKVGDRVRHCKFGEGIVVESMDGSEKSYEVCVRFSGWDEYENEDDYHPICESAIWHDQPPDIRKRLREYTDLADDDVVVIAGVDWTWKSTTADGGMISNGGCTYGYCLGPLGSLLVDEVRREPRTKRRRVYEAMHHTRDDMDDADLVMDGERWRLVEETEVPR